MKKEDYLKAIEQIAPDEETKNLVWEQLNHQKTEKKTTFTVRKLCWGAAALALVCVAGVSAPAVASELKSLILRETPSYGVLNESIETSVYSKADEHIMVTVEELLSDGVVVDMTVKYTALDETGKEWLAGLEANSDDTYIYSVQLTPYMPNTIEYGVNFSYGTVELKDMATETERYFLAKLLISGRTYKDNQGVFRFPLTETVESVMIDISGNVEICSYKLEGEGVASDYYTPTFIEISPMSFVIYANNQGVYERIQDGDYHKETWLLPDEEIDSLEKKSYFIMKDGTKLQLPPGAHNATHAKPENMNSDLMLYSTRFYEEENHTPRLMNPDDFEAVVLNGVRFEFVK